MNQNNYLYCMNYGTIYHVRFFDEVNGKKDYYFGSLSAVFALFTPEVLGVKIATVYQQKLDFEDEYRTKFCVIRKDKLIRKPKGDG
ncbi:hypothetical protein CMU75_08985 [Elizabethkingia anophelis]|nr:hypothetical protein [Elizabethkingia anophelis]MDV3653251.1 hypothetical protein [Elizabethkingia anophelis]